LDAVTGVMVAHGMGATSKIGLQKQQANNLTIFSGAADDCRRRLTSEEPRYVLFTLT